MKEGVDPATAETLEPGEEDGRTRRLDPFLYQFRRRPNGGSTGADRAETVFNYHLGTQENWVDGVTTYKTVVYDDLYNGIDLHAFSRHGEMKYEFHIDPDADWSDIRLSYDGIGGLSIGEDGALHIATDLGEMVDEGLYIYQTIDGEQVEVAGAFTLLDADTYAFTVTGEYDPSVELVIDPELEWNSYIGGGDFDGAKAVATDASGNVYVAGITYASNWLSGGWDTSHGGDSDGFVVALSPDGAHRWSTYLGGADHDDAAGVATDASGNVYVAGDTYSSDWVSGGWNTSHGGSSDGFVVALSPDGAHRWSTYLGGADYDDAAGVATDASGDVYVAGGTDSSGWVSGGENTSHAGDRDAFVVAFSSEGTHRWSTYLGGADFDSAYGIATDVAGNVYVAGGTESSGWVSGGENTSYEGNRDAFVVALSTDGAHRWSTYLGGASFDSAYGVATDALGNVYVAGRFNDGSVVKLSSNGAHRWSTYLGKSGTVADIAADDTGYVYVVGTDMYWVAHDEYYRGYLVALSPDGASRWSTDFTATMSEHAEGVATDASGNVYVTGLSDYDGFVAKMNDPRPLPGDLNGDRFVGSADLDIVRANWGATVTPGDLLHGDPSGNGIVNSADLDIVRANWGAGTQPAAVADCEDSASAFSGPRRAAASDEIVSAWRDSDRDRGPSNSDLAMLAEAAWLREMDGRRSEGRKKTAKWAGLSEMMLGEE